MANGIEVAGLALAVFPIVVKGMENLIETAEIFKSWKRYRMVLAEYLQTIKDAGAFFIDTAEQLLEDIIVTKDDLDTLKHDPAGVVLANPRYEELLKMRLDHNYDNFLKTLQKMFAALEGVQKKLGLEQQAGKIVWDDYSTLEREFKRLKMILPRGVYMQILDEIDKANRKLRECTHQSRLLEPSRNRIRSSRTRVQFNLIRRRFKSLRSLLISRKAWDCNCEQDHATCLRLDARPRHDCADNHGQESTQEPKNLRSVDRKVRIIWYRTVLVMAGIPKSVKKSVRFDALAIQDRSTTLQSSSPVQVLDETLKEISSLCEMVQIPMEQEAHLGFLKDKSVDGHQHNTFLTKNSIGPTTHHSSLREWLEVSRQQGREHGLGWEDSLRIAITLASSVIQLDGTGWLKSHWSSQDIIFPLPEVSKDDGQHEINHSHPYATSNFNPHNPSTDAQTSTINPSTLVDCGALVALGVTLVELCFGRAIEQLRKPQDDCANAAMTRWNTACRLQNYVYSERGEKYGSVVKRCLEGRFDVASNSLEDEDLQQAVVNLVVVPLQTELRNHVVG
ncbi:MAG: hypothetical protein Q9212_007258 [Teloschistes hypoglaucus]